MRLVFTIVAVLLVTGVLLTANKYLPYISISLSQQEFINGLLKYQALALLISFMAIFLTLKLSPDSRLLLKFGDLGAIAIKEKWLGINGKSTWRINGLQLGFFISIATAIFMVLAVRYTNSLSNFQWHFLPIILLISLTNSFSEEMIYRFAINGNLTNFTSKTTLLIVSGILFGLPHYLGFPSGIIGVMMATVLGYILSKATYETQGLGIAWAIHFLQDIIIFTAMFMMNVKA